jgi:hypothetical protein
MDASPQNKSMGRMRLADHRLGTPGMEVLKKANEEKKEKSFSGPRLETGPSRIQSMRGIILQDNGSCNILHGSEA